MFRKEIALEDMPIVTLTNGLRVGNHSSGHPFTFEDGTILPACSEERSEELKMVPFEERRPSACGRWTDVGLEFGLPAVTWQAIIRDAANPDVDVILIPLPMLIHLRGSEWLGDDNVKAKARAIRRTARTGNIIHIDRFCV